MSQSKSLNLVGLWLLALGCGTASTPSESTADGVASSYPGLRSSASDVAEPRPAPPAVDASKPMPLDAWRAVQADALAAIAEPDAAKKVARCREFVAKHGDHPEAATVIDALFEALAAEGEPDKAELATLARKRVALEPNGHERPFELLRDVHLEHTLPIAEVDAMIAIANERLVQEAADAELETNEEYKQYMRLAVKQSELDLATLEARIHLAHGDGKKALEVLARARGLGDAMAKHVVAFGSDGKPVQTFRTGAFDSLAVLEAAAHHELGDDAAARTALGQVVGFVNDLQLRKLYDETRKELGDEAQPVLTVRGEPELAQPFALESLSGKTTKLAKYKGKVVLVAFWATWCGPCKKELPHLQKFAKDNAKKGVELVTISIDDFASRSKIKPFLATNRLDLEVLFEDPKQLGGYDYSAIPALYVIDRDGKIAHARTGYDRDLDDKLANEIKDVVDGKPSQGRELVTLEQAPGGWKVLWQKPVMGDVSAVAIAAPVGKAAGEVGIVGREGLARWTADGGSLPAQPLTGWAQSLRTTDLDADGKREWLVGGWQDVKVLDDKGTTYWERAAEGLQLVVGLRDLDGDGFEEIVVRSENRVIALKADAKEMWRSRPFARIESAHIGPAGEVLVQADGDLVELDGRGAEAARRPAPAERNLSGRMEIGGKTVDVFEAKFDASPRLRHDIDADGKKDIVVVSEQGIIAYDGAGTPVLELRTHENDMSAAIGDLDGKPGDEIALAIRHYGVVVLGRS